MQNHAKVAFDASDEIAVDNALIFGAADKIVNMFVATNFVIIVTIKLLVVSLYSEVMHLKRKSDSENKENWNKIVAKSKS